MAISCFTIKNRGNIENNLKTKMTTFTKMPNLLDKYNLNKKSHYGNL